MYQLEERSVSTAIRYEKRAQVMFTLYRIAFRSVAKYIPDRAFVHTEDKYVSTLFILDSS